MDKVEDIVGRLRHAGDIGSETTNDFMNLCNEAADLIQSQQALIEEMREALQASLDKMEFVWQELDARDGLCRNVLEVPDNKLWKAIVLARKALSQKE